METLGGIVMKKVVLTLKAKKTAIITGIAVVCVGVLTFVLLQQADVKSEKLYTASSTASTAESSSANSSSLDSSETSSALSYLQNTVVSSASERSNGSEVCSSTSEKKVNSSSTESVSGSPKAAAASNFTNTSTKKDNSATSAKSGTKKASNTTSAKSSTKAAGSATSNDNPEKTYNLISAYDIAKNDTPYNIEADKQAIIAYGESRGLHYNPDLRPENSSWAGRDDLLIDDASDADIIEGCKADIDGMIRLGYAGADFNPYFEKKSDKINDYYSYVLYR
jgi:hypothetical protein